MPEYVYRGTRPEEAEQIMELWKIVFPDSNQGILRSFLETDPWRDGRYGRVCEDNGRLVSISYIGRRPVMTRKGVRLMGGIGYVGTRPEYRGQGINTRVMNDCLRVMEEDGIHFSTLITPINPYYERIGYQTIPRPSLMVTPGWDGWHPQPCHSERSEESPAGTGTIPETILRGAQDDIALELSDSVPEESKLLKVYLAFNQDRPIAVVRDEAYWEGWIRVRHAGARWLLAWDGGELVGYFQIRTQEDSFRIPEFGWLPGRPELPGRFARALVVLAAAERKPAIRLSAPIEPPLRDAFHATGAFTHVDHAHNTMFRRICMEETEYQELCREITQGTGVLWGADCT